eukprot:TRINITY_DN19684_c0_g1_i1.p1 TRINITY_DN19684_c0_g1~~TRINITY_DN19684_c0_g1_i1.p1  ORF type:complete len:299 (+),score=65.50 TRINITY_DN19684_c0_g1_i1:92-988(+)
MDAFILVVTVLINWINLTYLLQYMIPRVLSDKGGVVIWELVFYGVCLALGCWSYYVTMTTHPGRVPVAWRENCNPYPCDESQPLQPESRRYCPTCAHWKPPRTHHCSACKRCVLRYDHHCPWVGNCIGYYNHKSFLLLIVYIPIVCWTIVATAAPQAQACFPKLFLTRTPTADPPPAELLFASVSPLCESHGLALVNFCATYATTFVWGVLLTLFSIQHYFLMLRNKTTLESLQQNPENPYDLGFKRNCLTAFGSDWWNWLFPTSPFEITEHGGTSYEIKRGEYRPPSPGLRGGLRYV